MSDLFAIGLALGVMAICLLAVAMSRADASGPPVDHEMYHDHGEAEWGG